MVRLLECLYFGVSLEPSSTIFTVFTVCSILYFHNHKRQNSLICKAMHWTCQPYAAIDAFTSFLFLYLEIAGNKNLGCDMLRKVIRFTSWSTTAPMTAPIVSDSYHLFQSLF